MAPEWWLMALNLAESFHDPDEFEGREWTDLTEDERENAIQEAVIEIGVFE